MVLHTHTHTHTHTTHTHTTHTHILIEWGVHRNVDGQEGMRYETMGEVDAANATYRSINALCWSPAVIWKCTGTGGGFGDAYAQDKICCQVGSSVYGIARVCL